MVTFETKVYENDWQYILKGDYLEKMINRCNYDFQEKILFINNVNNKEKVREYAQKKIDLGIIDKFYFVEDYSALALEYFDILKDTFVGGYYYSISELVGIFLCKTDYLLHFSSDSLINDSKVNWIGKSIEIFNKRTDIIVSNPNWSKTFDEAKKESINDMTDFYLGSGFSDQCYLIRMDVFRGRIYNEFNQESERYPKYGGNLFEKRVDSFMRNNNYYRITSKEIRYVHKNFPKNHFVKLLNSIDINFFNSFRL